LVDRTDICPVKNLCHMSAKVLFWNRWKKKTEEDPASTGSPGKQLLNEGR